MPEPLSYSQFSEDRLVWEFFGGKPGGFFLEIGANDPENLSQTFLLERNGWEGILVEPQRDCCERLRQRRSKSRIFQVACGAPEQKGRAQFHISTRDDRSGLARHRNDEDVVYARTEEVEVLPVDDLLARAGNPKIDFVSIDVEGTELDVLRGFTLETHRPALLLIEDHVHSLDVHRHLACHGYKLVKRTGSNNWYVPKDAPFAMASVGERLKLFRKMYLGTPLRQFRRFLKRWPAKK